MSEDTRDRMIGALFGLHRNSEQLLNDLQDRAHDMQQSIQTVAKEILAVATGQKKTGDVSFSLPTEPAISQLMQEIDALRTKVDSYEAELRDMGYGDYLN